MSDVSSAASGTTGAGGGNMIRLTGLSSGLDVDALVKKMMAAEQTKLDKAKQQQQTVQWRQEAYQDIIKDIKDLQSSFFDTVSSDKNILSSANFAPYTISAADGSSTVDTSVATFTPGVGAKTGKYSINIAQLAASAGNTGSKIARDTSSGFTLGNWSEKSIGFSIGGNSEQTITLASTNTDITTTVNDINAKINANSSLKGKVQAVVNGGKIQFQAITDSNVKISNTTVNSDMDNLNGRVINPSTSTTMGDLGLSSSGNITFNYNNKDYSVAVKTTDKISDVMNNISAATSSLVKASYSQLSGTFTIQSVNTGSSQSFKMTSDFSALGLTKYDSTVQVGNSIGTNITTDPTMATLGMTADSTLKFKYNGTDYTVDVKTTDKISDVINNIHTKNANVTASFDTTTGQFKLEAKNSDDIISVTSDFATLGLKADTTYGKDAIVNITPPGASSSTNVVKSNNNFTIDGMKYTLSSTGNESVTVGQDTQKVYDKIKGFIDKYNTIVDEIQTKLNEKKNSDYKPLTDSQKSSMSTSEITAWETKAKVGILRNDDKLENMLNDLKTAFVTGVKDAGLEFGKYGDNSIGLDTSDTEYDKPAHIYIEDESKLKDAIATKSEQILKMFTNVSATSAPIASDGTKIYDSSTQEYQEDGIFTRIKSIFETNVGLTNVTLNTAVLTSYANKQYDFSSTGSGGKNTLPDQIYEQQLMIKKITSEMSDKQEKYYQQFSKLETAMTQLNAQQSQLSSMLGN